MESKASKESMEQLKICTEKNGVNAQKRLETPSTPGRPLFCFSTANLHRKSFPSKWDNAEKWLMNSSCHESPAHGTNPSVLSISSNSREAFPQRNAAIHRVSSEALLKGSNPFTDKFTDSSEPVGQFREGEFLFKKTETLASALHSRDVGTEITPLCSLNASSCQTPVKSSSPARHNTPADRSGHLVASGSKFDISELNNFHFGKLELSSQCDSMFCNWSSKKEEEEELSESLRQFEMKDGRSIAESRASLWEEEERAKSCIRYQREEAKIQAWVNLQTAKAEEKSKKLEVKIQNMRSNLEEKLMKRMAVVHRRSEELRAEAQLQHSQQLLKAAEQSQRMRSQQSCYLGDHHHSSCGCFPMQQ